MVTSLLLLVLAWPGRARADEEGWLSTELRVPVPRGGGFVPTSVRLANDARFGGRSPGLGFLALRVGPIWDVNRYLYIAAHGTAIAVQRDPKVFLQEYRLEFEPNLRASLGPLSFNDRNRVELRWLGGDINWRYRNQFRVNYNIKDVNWIPFIWDELIFNLSEGELSQNRAQIGIGWAFMPFARLDLGYMLRTRRVSTGGWANDHIINLSLFFAPPPPSR
jgi:hypothetical protein